MFTLLVMLILWVSARWFTNRHWDKRAAGFQRLRDEVKQTIEEHERECRLYFVIDGKDAEEQWPEIQRFLDARYGIKADQVTDGDEDD